MRVRTGVGGKPPLRRRLGGRGLALLVALSATGALAQARYDHHGALGLTVSTGGEILATGAVGSGTDNGLRLPVEVGGTLSVTSRSEARLAARVTFFGQLPSWSAYAGVRSSFGYEQLKTFFDLDFAAHFYPVWTLGARVAVGLQYDFLPVMGVYSTLGGQLGGGAGLRLSFELMVGLQFRTYLFE
ncbi:MAG: hypothetical protein AB1938_02535 [Myxococcota bacterium]